MKKISIAISSPEICEPNCVKNALSCNAEEYLNNSSIQMQKWMTSKLQSNEQMDKVYLPMNGVNNDWLSVDR